jgi:O-succinylbenzoic acid--CoA ligase
MINQKFNVDRDSNWLISLPLYYMGGASIFFRANESKAKIFMQDKWDPAIFMKLVAQHNISHTSLVPTQIYDLLSGNLKIPSCLKYLFVGGDALNSVLRTKCLDQGLPVFLTYGQTEFCSQVATIKLELAKDGLELLPGIKATCKNNELLISSPFHFERYISLDRQLTETFYHENLLGQFWYPSGDLGTIYQNKIKITSRADDFIKIKSKFYNLKEIEDSFFKNFPQIDRNKSFISASNHERDGKFIYLMTTSDLMNSKDCKNIQRFLKDSKISNIFKTHELKKNHSGKIIKKLNSYSGDIVESVTI